MKISVTVHRSEIPLILFGNSADIFQTKAMFPGECINSISEYLKKKSVGGMMEKLQVCRKKIFYTYDINDKIFAEGVYHVEKRILNYRKYIDELLTRSDLDWEAVIREHLIQIAFFQHERLVHLIVTITFALIEVIVFGLCVVSFTPGVGLLAIVILILLIPYIRHYYILENEVHKMYMQYDKMVEERDR